LRDHPEAFGSSVEEEQDSDLAYMIGVPPNVTLGGFVDGALVGTVAMIVSPKVKQRHKGLIVGVYVAPPWRGSGLAAGLVDRLIANARDNGLATLALSVSLGNHPARRLYMKAGFIPYGIEPCGMMIGSQRIDVEHMTRLLD
jgi:GNAT superfamily N-acetyltransferase